MSQGNLVIAVRSDAADDEATAAAHPDDMATCLGMHHLTRPAEAPRGESSAHTKTDPTALLMVLTPGQPSGAPDSSDIVSGDVNWCQRARWHPARAMVEPRASPSSYLMVPSLLVGFGSWQGQAAAEKLSTLCLNWTLSL